MARGLTLCGEIYLMSTCLLIHLLDELVFVVVLLGIAEGGTDAAGDLDGEPVAVPVVALPVVPVDLAGALAVGHGETGGGGPGAGTGAANGDNLAAACLLYTSDAADE